MLFNATVAHKIRRGGVDIAWRWFTRLSQAMVEVVRQWFEWCELGRVQAYDNKDIEAICE